LIPYISGGRSADGAKGGGGGEERELRRGDSGVCGGLPKGRAVLGGKKVATCQIVKKDYIQSCSSAGGKGQQNQ